MGFVNWCVMHLYVYVSSVSHSLCKDGRQPTSVVSTILNMDTVFIIFSP